MPPFLPASSLPKVASVDVDSFLFVRRQTSVLRDFIECAGVEVEALCRSALKQAHDTRRAAVEHAVERAKAGESMSAPWLRRVTHASEMVDRLTPLLRCSLVHAGVAGRFSAPAAKEPAFSSVVRAVRRKQEIEKAPRPGFTSVAESVQAACAALTEIISFVCDVSVYPQGSLAALEVKTTSSMPVVYKLPRRPCAPALTHRLTLCAVCCAVCCALGCDDTK